MPATLDTPRQVAVADDTPDSRDNKCQYVRLAGFRAVPLEGRYLHIKDLLDAMKDVGATALVCDHKLTEGNYAGFAGVEAVAELYGSSTPGILVTDYVDSDLRHSIRKYRKRVPVMIRGSEMRPHLISAGIEAWEKEVIRQEVPVWRRPRRAFVVIDEVGVESDWGMHTVFVPRWREHEAVALPLDLIPADLRPHLKKGSILVASVNTEAERIEDLFFDRFELTPEEDLEHEPA